MRHYQNYLPHKTFFNTDILSDHKTVLWLQFRSYKLSIASHRSTHKVRQHLLTYQKISKFQNLIFNSPSSFIFFNETYKMIKKQILWIVVSIISLKIRSKFVLKNSVLWKKACFSVSNMNKEVLQRFRFQSFTLKIPRARRSFSKVALRSTNKVALTSAVTKVHKGLVTYL